MRSYKHKRRKKKIGQAGRNFIIMISCLLCVFIITVIVGNVLGKKADLIDVDTTEQTTQKQSDEDAVHAFNPLVLSVNSKQFKIEGLSNNQINSQITKQLSGDISAVTVDVLDNRGNPNFNSAVAKQFYDTEEYNANLDINTLISRFESKGIKVCFRFEFSAFEIEDKNVRYAKIAYQRAIVAEVASEGAEEILLSGFIVKDDMALNQYLSLVDELKISCPQTFFGVSFEHTYYTNKNNIIAPILYTMSAVADFSAFDITGLDDDIDAEQFIEQYRYYVNRYNLRILFTYRDEAQYKEFTDMLSSKEIYNWQAIGE